MKSDKPKSLDAVIRNSIKNKKLMINELSVNQGEIYIEHVDSKHHESGLSDVVFEVIVPSKKFSYKNDNLHVSAASIRFQLIATDCTWSESKKVYEWLGEKNYKVNTDKELVNVVTYSRGKVLNHADGQFFKADGLEEFQDEGISTQLVVNIINNSTTSEIYEVLDFCLEQMVSLK